jgi:transcriptional regulator with XRE-family HTH domain
MTQGRKPNIQRRREAAQLRGQGLSLKEIARHFGISRQGVASLLSPLRKPHAVACRRCGKAIAPAGAVPRDAGKALCLDCLAKDPMAPLGDQLRAYRLAAGLTPTELARRAGVLPTTVAYDEEGRARPRPATLARLAAALGAPLADLQAAPPAPGKRAPGRPPKGS